MTYTQQIVEVIRKYLKDGDWNFSFDEDDDVFTFGLSLHKSKMKKLHYLIGVREDDFVVYAISPIGVDIDDPNMVAAMTEFLIRANYGMLNGCFEMDMSDGEIRYKSYVDCEGQLPSKEIIGNSIHCPAAMFDRYGDGLLSVIFNGADPKTAVDICEGKRSSPLARSSDNEEDSEITRSLIDALSKRFDELSGGGEDPDPDEDDDEDDGDE